MKKSTIKEQRGMDMNFNAVPAGISTTVGTVGEMSNNVNYAIQQLQGQAGQELASMGGPIPQGIQILTQYQKHLSRLPQDEPLSGQPRLLKALLKWALRKLGDLCLQLFDNYND